MDSLFSISSYVVLSNSEYTARLVFRSCGPLTAECIVQNNRSPLYTHSVLENLFSFWIHIRQSLLNLYCNAELNVSSSEFARTSIPPSAKPAISFYHMFISGDILHICVFWFRPKSVFVRIRREGRCASVH